MSFCSNHSEKNKIENKELMIHYRLDVSGMYIYNYKSRKEI
uniref:Uncharacterized protein n=1 Tax=Photobacterium damselae subsp. damselae TaxID=85581 RepID=E4WLI7_PHODD|nr:hypothetical protein [Photobacterium damselae subsp. damselae]